MQPKLNALLANMRREGYTILISQIHDEMQIAVGHETKKLTDAQRDSARKLIWNAAIEDATAGLDHYAKRKTKRTKRWN